MAAFLFLNAALVIAAYALSGLGLFNRTGYLVVLPLLFVCGLRFRSRVRIRVRRVLPRIFFAVALLSLIGGIAHPPSQYDALTYRLPRILHWAAEGRIHWIDTVNDRMNYAAAGHEFVVAPLLLVFRSDRLLFIPNLIAFLLLPGAIFTVLRRWKTPARIAWNWMWLFPTGYCFAMQAGGVGNDAYGAALVLGSVEFALRVRESRRFGHFALAVLGAAMVSSVKASNLPLLLPLGAAILPSLGIIRDYPARTALLTTAALMASFFQIGLANQQHTGSWTGDPANVYQMKATHSGIAFVGNALELSAKCVEPPVLPKANSLGPILMDRFPGPLKAAMARHFPRFDFMLSELPQEENSGLGLPLCLLLTVALVTGRPRWYLPWTTTVAFLVYMLSLASESTGRLLAPYYPLLAIPFLTALSPRAARTRWWRWLAVGCAASVLLPILITPSRPIVPPEMIVRVLRGSMAVRTRTVYETYEKRHDMLGPLREAIPADVKRVGAVIGLNDSELSLWMPYGRREVTTGESTWWVIGDVAGADEWIQWYDGRVRLDTTLTTLVRQGPRRWRVVEFPAPQNPRSGPGPIPR